MKQLLFLVIIFFISSCGHKPHEVENYPFQDTNFGIEQRVNDLLGRMTLEEKIGQMMNDAPAIERLGIPQYNWWNECLHGVARSGLATVFPQAIGLGATWDEDLIFRMATVISDEARAKYHNYLRKNHKTVIFQGLTFWSPNINLFRDPRWGRGQETYGEDPFLTGRLAVQFIKGLQGDDPVYFKTIATVKHYAVHSGPEPDRHSFNAVIDERDLRETYLPQFELGIKEAKAYSAMCAYNRFNGEACCGSNRLLVGILRNEWGFKGYVVSDCGAINDIYDNHKIVESPEEAAAMAVKSGCDLECGQVYRHLKKAVAKGLITEQEIDVAVKRLFTARFKLGMFDPPEMVKYAQIPYAVLDSKEHRDLALEASRKSIVLLKNENNLLPLKKDIKTIAVIGPNADQWQVLLGNYNGQPADPITPLRGIREKVLAETKVLYTQGCELTGGLPAFSVISPEFLFSDGNTSCLKGEYFNNRNLSGDPLYVAVDKNVDFSWFDGAPRSDMDGDNFSVRWSGQLRPDRSGEYKLGLISSCKVRLYLDDEMIVSSTYHYRDEFGDARLRDSKSMALETGKNYNIRIEAEESYGDARVQLVWTRPATGLSPEALEAATQADAVVLCMGLSPRLEGEQMPVNLDGFRGGDRTSLALPQVQQDLIKQIKSVGKPIVLVLLNGSALAVNWESENIPAIIEAWYPGQAGGSAIADVLFGDYNPAGRLPVTFYKSVADLPPFEEYAMAGRTYRYFQGEPLFPFGYGLSYTSFNYANLKVEPRQKINDSIIVSAEVKNTGKTAGDEVVQVYLSNLQATVPVPLRALVGFQRIHLQPGETKTVSFSIPPAAFSVINNNNECEILPGEFEISVGGRQPHGIPARDSGILQARINLK